MKAFPLSSASVGIRKPEQIFQSLQGRHEYPSHRLQKEDACKSDFGHVSNHMLRSLLLFSHLLPLSHCCLLLRRAFLLFICRYFNTENSINKYNNKSRRCANQDSHDQAEFGSSLSPSQSQIRFLHSRLPTYSRVTTTSALLHSGPDKCM